MTQAVRTRLWPASSKPAIESQEPPFLWADYGALLEMAETLLESRRDRFPKLIAKGELDQEEADRELLAFEYLVQNWRFIRNKEGEPAGHGADYVLREALDKSLTRIAVYAGKQGGFDLRLSDQAHSIIALRWHLEPGRQTIAMARLTQSIREDLKANQKAKTNA